MSGLGGVKQAVLDVRRRRTVSGALLDKGTFPWYKRENGGGVKLLILLLLNGSGDNPPLGTKATIFCDFLRHSAMRLRFGSAMSLDN